MRVGSSASASAPNSASGRLLPVDVKPGTRQSLTVFHHLDGHRPQQLRLALVERRAVDRKSTRLNSSHDQISYAVFCLKKKKNTGKPRGRLSVRRTLRK